MPIRVHVVDYLNAWPLAWGLREPPDGFEVRWGTPAECADALETGEADLGLVPTAALARIEGLRVFAGHGICCRGPVASVLLMARRPWREVRRVALDRTSRTSAELARLALRWREVEAEYVVRPPDPVAMLEEADAALLIGDRALRVDRTGLEVMDLGEAWFHRTGLPFVFAVWAARPGTDLRRAGEALRRSADMGIASLAEIAREGALREGLAEATVLRYLTTCIRYPLGEEERTGLRRFLDLLVESGRVTSAPPLEFHPEAGDLP